MSTPESTRRQPRFTVELALSVDSDQQFYMGTATNLSLGGFFIASFIQQKVGDRFAFTIELPGDRQKIKGTGEVRWIRSKAENTAEPAGMGIRFVELTDESPAILEQYLSAPRSARR